MSTELIANELLAFLQHQLDVMDEISITQICTSNFSEDEIRKAKTLLYVSLHMVDQMPSRRRDEKGERSLNDIIRLLKEVDPDDVPTFVAKDLRKLPPVTFDHVDVTRLLKEITSLKSGLENMKLKFDASQAIISDLRTEIDVCSESVKLNESPTAARNDSLRPALSAAPPETSSKVIVVSPHRGYSSVAAAKAPVRPKETRMPTQPRKESGKTDAEGFIKVERRKRKPVARNLCGTAPTGPNHLLRPAIPMTQLYVSRLHHSIKTDEMMEYIEIKTKLRLKVVQLDSRHQLNFKSFVVRVPNQHLATFMKEDFWPKGVVFRRFRGRLADTSQRNASPIKTCINK